MGKKNADRLLADRHSTVTSVLGLQLLAHSVCGRLACSWQVPHAFWLARTSWAAHVTWLALSVWSSRVRWRALLSWAARVSRLAFLYRSSTVNRRA